MTKQLGIHSYSYISHSKKKKKARFSDFHLLYSSATDTENSWKIIPSKAEQIPVCALYLSGLQTGIVTLIKPDFFLPNWLDQERLRKDIVRDRNPALRRMSLIIKLGCIEVLVKDRLSSHAIAEYYSFVTLSRTDIYQPQFAIVMLFPFTSINQTQTTYDSRFEIISTMYYSHLKTGIGRCITGNKT